MPLGDPVTLKVPNAGRVWRDMVADPPSAQMRVIWGWCPDEPDPQGGWGVLTLLVRGLGGAWRTVMLGVTTHSAPSLWSRVESINEPDVVDPNPPPPSPGPRKCWLPSWRDATHPGVGNTNVGTGVTLWTINPAGPAVAVPDDPNNPGGGPHTWTLRDPYPLWALEALRPADERRW